MKAVRNWLHQPFFIRLLHWEYWSFNTVYGPILPIYLLIGARARSFFFFSAANPGIRNGGFLMESKKEIYDLMPACAYPQTAFFTAGSLPDQVIRSVREKGLTYPLIAKPDVGARGRGVRKIGNDAELSLYCRECPLDFLVQEFISHPLEAGIFYCRLPGEEKGRITGIVTKEFMTVTGDGQSTLRELVLREDRYILQLPDLEKLYGDRLNDILPAGGKKELVPFGNHARGSKFMDDSHLADDALLNVVDQLCQQIPGFRYGRLDIRFVSWELLKQGKQYSVIELNGSGSEPTHIYDPRHSIFFAWKEIIRHWWLLSRVARDEHRKGIPYLTVKEGLQLFRDDAAFNKKINTIRV
ncbi:hypothetical protein [Flavihumibacter petaseus]|uniref:ATP-grasp domain-containing protein n=1 Tax=Flavihumibacter petaseus NBRC 106054 TaxID=1220578 RepID=A0A0E9N414_9BACT|nr:hypothetical protein [Flavihumibacter petaseus]GAO44396.1 hypothetical protein FPE01S_03_04340 [Flavihumibacter petaseus NBRC 106054]